MTKTMESVFIFLIVALIAFWLKQGHIIDELKTRVTKLEQTCLKKN